jgi:RNA polymerase sigma-70 factor (ECF subfamily)
MELTVAGGQEIRGEGLPDPARLVARIREGERTAEEELVRRYTRGVSIILRRLAGTAAAADDLYQEVFLRAVEKIRAGEVRDPERLSGFICALARNLAIDHFRRRAPEKAPAEPEARLSIPDPAPGPLARVLHLEDSAIIRQVMNELPSDRDRQVLRRFYLEEDDKDAICADLNLTSLHFNRVLHRARERFRELYKKAGERH